MNLNGGGLNFLCGCVPYGFPKNGSRERIFRLEKLGVLGTKKMNICVLRAEILVKTRLEMHNFSKN